MSSLKILVPLLAATAPLCSSFAPLNPSVSSRASIEQPHVLRAAPCDEENNNLFGDSTPNTNALDRVGKVAGSAFLALTLSFTAFNAAPVPFADTPTTVPSANAAALPSITIAAKATSGTQAVKDEIIKVLEEETQKEEKLVRVDAKKAKVEASREKFFDYEAKMAEQQEARIEAAEKKAEIEFENDKEEADILKAMEEKAERDEALATTKQEKADLKKEERALLKKEKEIERKEKKAARAERIFLAEEAQEQKIVRQKEDAAIAEEKKFEEVEKEYESVAELAKEEEVELSLLKGLKK